MTEGSWAVSWRSVEQTLRRHAWARYGAAAALVGATLLLRWALAPVFTGGVYYHLYYPAVILAAYLLGAGPGFLATGIAALGGHMLFGATSTSYLSLTTFMISSTLVVALLSHVRGRLRFLQVEYERIDALTRSQADLFREHAGRVSDHLQLISALLQLQARQEANPISTVMKDAASRTLLISRMHRTFLNGGHDAIDFKAFATRLAEAALAARDRPPVTVIVEGERLSLPLEQASALGLILMECINARADLKARGVMRVVLGRAGTLASFQIVDEGVHGAPSRDMALLGAVAEQMRASLVLSADAQEASLQLAFPAALQTLPQQSGQQRVH